MNSSSILVSILVLALAGTATAQGVNVDIGWAGTAPSTSFGAAATQPGVWNVVGGEVAGPVALVDLAGGGSSITLARTSGASTASSYDNFSTSGDDGLLMDDFADVAPSSTWTIGGLAAGSYSVYTYAWAPDSATAITGVVVNGGPQTSVGGAWPGSYLLGTTHALDNVTIPAAATITITLSHVTSYLSLNGLQIKPNPSVPVSYCAGDGSDNTCPCGNPSVGANRGCNNTVASGGARITSSGGASISSDTLVLNGTGAVPFGPGLFYQGSTTANPSAPFGVTFGNGLRCAGGSTPRLEIRLADGIGASNTTVAIHALGSCAAGDNRNYQLWYRDAPSFGSCVSGFNLSNAINLTWVP